MNAIDVETAARVADVEQLRHSDRLTTIGTLASGFAHELGTPLNVVSGRAQEIVSGDAVGAQITQNARIIVDQSRRMAEIVRQLLDFARRGEAERSRIQMGGLAAQVLSLLRPMAGKRRVDLPPPTHDGSSGVYADEAQMRQVLTNVVVNAIQASPEGGVVRVDWDSETRVPADRGGGRGTYLRLRVLDQGHGMSRETLARIFEPFFTTKAFGEGTGLGLWVASGIVKEHGGWIEVESELGCGTVFSICLPSDRERGVA